MPIGVGAAMLIGSAVSGGAAVAGAKMQSNAAKNAQKAQQAGTDKALQAQLQANQPYMQLGQQAAARLGQMGATQQPYTQVFGSGRGVQGQPGQPQTGPGSMGGPPMPPKGIGLGQFGQVGMGAPLGGGQPASQAMQRPGMAPQGGTVRMTGPDGQPRDVPQQFAQQAMQAGFRRLG